jgi:hypothetical protein
MEKTVLNLIKIIKISHKILQNDDRMLSTSLEPSVLSEPSVITQPNIYRLGIQIDLLARIVPWFMEKHYAKHNRGNNFTI